MKDGFCDFSVVDFSYFDYAATTYMPKCVIEKQFHYNRNIGVSSGRGKSRLSAWADSEFQKAREDIKSFFGKGDRFIFYRGATYALNEVVYSLEHMIESMDIVLLGPYEHHSNYLPWREICKKKGAILFEMPLKEDGSINIEYLKELKSRIKIISFSSVANTNGFRMNVGMIESVLNEDTVVIVDDSQKCAHEKLEITDRIDCHIVNSHKMYGPKGIAGAMISERMFRMMRPCIFGGGMVERIGFPNIWKANEAAFECGTIDVGNVLAWREACNYIADIGYENIQMTENCCYERIIRILKKKLSIEIVSDERTKSLISFYHKKLHAHDIEEMFSEENIIIRSGHLCSQNSIAKYNKKPLVRISFGISVDENDLVRLAKAIEEYL